MPVRHGEGDSGGRYGSSRYSATLDSVYNANLTASSASNNNNKTNTEEDYNNFRLSQRTPSQNSLDRLVKENDMLHSRLGTRKSVGNQQDAMRFVKTGAVTTMAEKAKDTANVMQHQKEQKKSVEMMEDDWQSNLSSWKSKMRKKSVGSLQRTQESLDVDTDVVLRKHEQEDSNGNSKRRSKTFKEIMEEKDQRKSGSFNIYPMDDSEDSAFSSQGSKGRPSDNDDKLSMFGFHKVDEPSGPTHSVSSATTHGRTIFDSRTHDRGHTGYGGRPQPARHSTVDTSSERKSTSLSVDDEPREEIASWAADAETTYKTTPKSTNERTSKPESYTPYQSRAPHTTKTNIQSQGRELPIEVKKSESPPKEIGRGIKSARDMFERTSEPEVRNIPVHVASSPRKIEVIHEPSQYSVSPAKEDTFVRKTVTKSFSKQETSSMPSGEWSRKQTTERSEEFHRSQSTSATAGQEKKDHIEKVIKISQKPDHEKGFGFTIRGGKEFSSPIVVEKVILDFTDNGGAADVCELMPGDEIIAINGALVANHYQQSVQLVINQAVKAGHIELRLHRSLDKAKLGLFEEEELQMEQEQRMLRLDHNRSKTRQESPSEKHDRPVLPPWETEREKNVESNRRNAASQGNSRDEKIPTWEQNRTYDIKTHVPSPSRKEYDRYVGNVPKDEVDVSHSSRSKEEYDTNMESTPQIPAPLAFIDDVTSLESGSNLDNVNEELLDRLEHVDIQQQQGRPLSQVAPPAGVPSDSDAPEADEPPPLPDAPPPIPNWNTFPDQISQPTDLSFLDAGDLVPDATYTQNTEPVDSIDTRLEKLRLKSEFLGQNCEDTEEYMKLQEEMSMELETKSEEDEWQKIEKQDHLSTTNLMSRFDQIQSPVPVTMETNHVTKDTTHVNRETSQVTREQTIETVIDSNGYHGNQSRSENNNNVPQYRHGNDLEIIAKLEDEERQRQDRVGRLDEQRRDEDLAAQRRWQEEELHSWRSMEVARPGGSVKDKTSHDGYRTYNQEKFDRDQEHLQHEQEKDLKRAEEIENEKKKQEEKLLEKELARQKELEEIKKRRDEERLLHQQEEEAHRKEQERKDEIAFRKRLHKEEIQRREQQQREEIERRQQKQKDEAERRAKQQRDDAERRQHHKLQEADMLDKREKERLRLEKERLDHQELELRAKERELRQLEAEKMKMIEVEQRRRLEELQRYEEEQKRKEEEDRRDEDAIRQKERELKELEERLRMEEAKLFLQREQLNKEKEQSLYKSDKVAVSYNTTGNLQKGNFEYVYQPEAVPPQQIDSGPKHPEPSRTMITERTEQYEIRSSPQVTPRVMDSGSPGAKRIIKREPLIPPKQSIKAELSSLSRKDIMNMNKKPAGQRGYDDSYQVSPSQARRRMDLQAHRKSWSPEVASHELSTSSESKPVNGDYADARANGMSRQEVMAMNRKAFSRQELSTPERDATRDDKSPSPTSHTMTKRTLHNLGAAPKPRLIGSQTWIREEPKKGARRSEVVRTSLGTLSEHWLVEEAERRRMAEQTGQEREAYPNSWSKV